ncbi:MAG: hypothetical protein LRY55_10545, partial [Leadbetterella sp.]|nr:hypothetical protein [Leadbetterella sp.]
MLPQRFKYQGVATGNSQVRFRQEPTSGQNLAIEGYLGYEEDYYNIRDGHANPALANYISLSACRESEKAADTYSGGAFSEALFTRLNNGGLKDSYRNIVQSLSATLSIKSSLQNPVAYPDNGRLDQLFLGGDLIPYTPSYEVRYLGGSGIWQLQGGALQGLVSSSTLYKTTVNITPGNIEVEVIDVKDFTSILQGDLLSRLDKNSTAYKATVKQLAIKKLAIGFSEVLKAKQELTGALKEAFDPDKHTYIELEEKNTVDYLIHRGEYEGKTFFYLTQAINDVPVFKSESDPLGVSRTNKWRHGGLQIVTHFEIRNQKRTHSAVV